MLTKGHEIIEFLEHLPALRDEVKKFLKKLSGQKERYILSTVCFNMSLITETNSLIQVNWECGGSGD